MQSSKKIFVGSLFDFRKPGEVVQRLQSSLPEAQVSSFFTYNKNDKVFSYEVMQPQDALQTTAIISQLASYIESNKESTQDLIGSPRLVPLAGTNLDGQLEHPERPDLDFTCLLGYESESENDIKKPTAAGFGTTYWMPREANINIMTEDIADAIVNRSGCSVYPEPADKRIRLVGGDSHKALQMLRNLEPLMSLVSRHKSHATSYANAHVLVLRTKGSKEAIKFCKLSDPHPGVDRIIVSSSHKPLVARLWVVETRTKRTDADDYQKPLNLDLDPDYVKPVTTISNSRFFQDIDIVEIGNIENEIPQEAVITSPQPSESSQDPSVQNRFLASAKATRVSEWSQNVDLLAGPDLAPQEPRSDDVIASRRRVVDESESESESDADFRSNFKSVKPEIPSISNKDTSALGFAVVPTPKIGQVENASPKPERQALPNNHDLMSPMSRHSTRIPTYNEGSKVYLLNKTRSTTNSFDLLASEDSASDTDVAQSLKEVEHVATDLPRIDALLLQSRDNEQHNVGYSVVTLGQQKPLAIDVPRTDQNHSHPGQEVNARLASKSSCNVSDSSQNSNQTRSEASNLQKRQLTSIATKTSSKNKISYRSGNTVHGGSSSGYSEHAQKHSDPEPHTLIEVHETTETLAPALPPPGLTYRDEAFGFPNQNLMDAELESIQRPAIRPTVEPKGSKDSDKTSSTATTNSLSKILAFTPHPVIRKRDVSVLRHQTINQIQKKAQLTSGIEHEDSIRSEKPMSPAKKHTEEGERSLKCHDTMSQKAPNPGKSPGKSPSKLSRTKNPVQAESKKDKEARIARAKAEAYGDQIPMVKLPKPSHLSGTVSEKMSARKQQLIRKNSTLASMHPDVQAQQVTQEQARKLLPELEIFFEACRALSGDVVFEFQLGQALVIQNNLLEDSLLYMPADFDKFFDHSRVPAMNGIFTNMITRNGYEIDQLLEVKTPNDRSRMWTKQSITKPAVVFEFVCQTSAGSQFSILLESSGDHKLLRNKVTVGKAALYFPGQVWDACASLDGNIYWKDPPANINVGAEAFVSSIYIPPKSRAVVFFRQPPNRAFNVRDVIVKRTSIHGCLILDREDCQMKITEVKSLIHNTHPTDRGLHRSSEGETEEMVRDGKIHYEASILNKPINDALSHHNNKIQTGDLTPKHSTGKSLLSINRLAQMIEITTHVIEEVDWLGSTNYGTYRQCLDEMYLARAEMDATMPPHVPIPVVPTIRPGTSGKFNSQSTLPIPQDTSRMTPAEPSTAAVPPTRPPQIHGIRVGEVAPLYKQGDQYFRLGVGGAKIPVTIHQEDRTLSTAPTNDLIMPDDSASQAGNGSGQAQIRARYRWNRQPEKPPGFW